MKKNLNKQELLKYSSAYSEKGFWAKLGDIAGKVGEPIIRMALTLYYMMSDPSVSVMQKAMIVAALGYLIAPVDLIPDSIPVLGLIDDADVMRMVYDMIKSSVTDSVREKVDARLDKLLRRNRKSA